MKNGRQDRIAETLTLGSTTERRMNGYPVIVNRLIDNVFWLICKDERKEGMIGLVRG